MFSVTIPLYNFPTRRQLWCFCVEIPVLHSHLTCMLFVCDLAVITILKDLMSQLKHSWPITTWDLAAYLQQIQAKGHHYVNVVPDRKELQCLI